MIRPDPVPVTVYRLARGTVEETVTNSKAGTVKARRRAKISPEIGGRVAFIGFRPGARVRKGDVLLRINDMDLKATLDFAEQDQATSRASAREACLSADLAARDLKRTLDLKDDRIVSVEVVDRLQSQSDASTARCQAARANAERAQASVDLARANLNKTVLRSPFDGIVADLKAEVGEWASPSPPALPIPPVFDIIDPTSIYISAPLDEVDAGKMSRGQTARITLDPYPNRSFKGRVTRVAPYVQDIVEQNRTLEVEVDLDDVEFARTLLPGTSADVEVILRSIENVLRLPTYALLEGDRVLVYDGGRLVSKGVTTGLRNWEYAEVKEGLAEGDPIVVSLDRAEVKEGVRAVIRDESGPQKSAGSGASGAP
jgi:HlyD family secretion protein